MQYNEPNGTLNITDNVNMNGTLRLASGTALFKTVAGISVHANRQDLPQGSAMSLVVAANEAPNFINVQASCRMVVNASGGYQEQPASMARAVLRQQSPFPDITLGSLFVYTFGFDSTGNQDSLSSGSSPAVLATLIANVDYNPAAAVTVTITGLSAAGIMVIDDTHRLTLICG